MRLRLRLLLPLILALLAGFAQYLVLHMFEAGRRQGIWVVASTFIVAAMVVYGIPRLKVSKVWQFAICVVAPAVAACAALLVAEKMDRPEITVVFLPDGLTIMALTIFMSAGWLVGLAAFCGSIFARAKKPLASSADL